MTNFEEEQRDVECTQLQQKPVKNQINETIQKNGNIQALNSEKTLHIINKQTENCAQDIDEKKNENHEDIVEKKEESEHKKVTFSDDVDSNLLVEENKTESTAFETKEVSVVVGETAIKGEKNIHVNNEGIENDNVHKLVNDIKEEGITNLSKINKQTEVYDGENFDGVQGQTNKEDGDSEEKAAAAAEEEVVEIIVEIPLPTLVYTEVAQLSRSMHYNDYEACLAKKRFITSRVTPKYKTLLPPNGDYVWFRAQSAEETSEKHDWFGNVRCSFDLLELLKKDPKINLFNVDCAYFGYSSASRILVTYQKNFKQFRKLNLKKLKYGDPIMLNDDGKLAFLSKDVNKDQTWFGRHQVEFVIDARSLGGKRMFNLCDKYAVNHSNANAKSKRGSFICHQCLIYNSARRKNCPSSWTQEHTHGLMYPNEAQEEIKEQ